MSARQVRFGHYLAYGANDFLGAGAMSIIGIWILFFYTTFCGLTAAEAGIIFVAARLLDAFFSPVIGYISDHFHHTWLGQDASAGGGSSSCSRSRWCRASRSCGWKARPSGTTSSPTASSSWCTRWKSSRTKRWPRRCRPTTRPRRSSRVHASSADRSPTSRRCGCPGVIIAHLGGKESADTFLYLGIIFSVFFVFVALAVFLFTWERPREEITSIEPEPIDVRPSRNLTQLFEDLAATMRIRAFRLHLGMYLGGYISQDILNGVFAYFIAFALAGTVATDVDHHHRGWPCAQLLSVGVRDLARACASTRRRRIASPHAVRGERRRHRCCSTSPASSTSRGCSSRWWSQVSGAARSTTSRGASTTTCPTSMKSSPAGGAKARSPAS